MLYHDRSLVPMLAMRRTMFVVPTEEVPVFHAAAALAIARTERKRNQALASMLGVRHPAAWLRKAEAGALTALEQRVKPGPDQRREDYATGRRIRHLAALIRRHGPGRWRKKSGCAWIRLQDGTMRRAELHWYEAPGIGRRSMKIKRYLEP